LGSVTIDSGNEYAAVSVVSLDGEPLASSRRVLVQVGTTARLDGWRTEPAEFDFQKIKIVGERIVNTGSPPWKIAATDVRLTIANPGLSHGRLLDASGYERGKIALDRQASGVQVKLPADAMYAVLE
jgi:hypothetical protein